MFLHIFLMPDSLILLKYCAPFIRIQEMRCPSPSEREPERVKPEAARATWCNETGALQTFKDVLELVLLQGGPHRLLDGRDVLVEFDHQRVVVHALHVGHNGVVALLGQGDQVVEAVHPGLKQGEVTKTEIFLRHTENLDLSGDKGVEKRREKKSLRAEIIILLCIGERCPLF